MVNIAPGEAIRAGEVIQFIAKIAVGLDTDEVDEKRQGSASENDAPCGSLGFMGSRR